MSQTWKQFYPMLRAMEVGSATYYYELDVTYILAPGSWIFLRGGGKVGICTVLAFSSDTRVVGATCS